MERSPLDQCMINFLTRVELLTKWDFIGNSYEKLLFSRLLKHPSLGTVTFLPGIASLPSPIILGSLSPGLKEEVPEPGGVECFQWYSERRLPAHIGQRNFPGSGCAENLWLCRTKRIQLSRDQTVFLYSRPVWATWNSPVQQQRWTVNWQAPSGWPAAFSILSSSRLLRASWKMVAAVAAPFSLQHQEKKLPPLQSTSAQLARAYKTASGWREAHQPDPFPFLLWTTSTSNEQEWCMLGTQQMLLLLKQKWPEGGSWAQASQGKVYSSLFLLPLHWGWLFTPCPSSLCLPSNSLAYPPLFHAGCRCHPQEQHDEQHVDEIQEAGCRALFSTVFIPFPWHYLKPCSALLPMPPPSAVTWAGA